MIVRKGKWMWFVFFISSLLNVLGRNIRIVPEVAAPGANIVVLVEDVNAQSGQATIGLGVLGEAEAITLDLELVGNRLMSAPFTLPNEASSFDGREIPVDVLFQNELGDELTQSLQLPTAGELSVPSDLLLELSPGVLTAGEDFAVFVNQSDLVDGQVEVNFAPESDVTLNLPLSFDEDRATALGAVPNDAAGSIPRLLNFMIDIVDLAGNQQRLIRPVTLNGDSQVVDDSPSVGGFSIEPVPLRPGEPFTVTTAVDNPELLGVMVLDFRPLAPSLLRLPLTIEGGTGTATGIVPASLPEFVEDFARLELVLFSEDGDRRDSRETLIPASGLPSAPDLSVVLDSIVEGSVTRNSEITLSGSVGSGVDSVEVSGVVASVVAGQFSLTVPLSEGTNIISITARGAEGESSFSNVTVRRDTIPPELNLEVPRNEAIITSAQTTVAGMVNDLVQGTVGLNEVAVTINDIPAVVTNRTYEISEFLLVPGENTLEIVATDTAGNTRAITRTVFFEDDAQQQRLLIGGGNNQEGLIGTALGDPLLVQAVDADGRAIPDVPISFSVIRGNGTVSLDELNERQITLQTDENGQAFAFFIIGQRTGEGNQRVEVTAPGFTGEVIFCASARDIQAGNLAALEPANQTGSFGEFLPEPLQAFVSDRGGNPIANVAVQFQVSSGSGLFFGSNGEITLFSDASGRIDVPFMMGMDEAEQTYEVTAVVLGSDPPLMTFFEGAVVMPGAESETTFSGFVLDSGNRPLPEVEVYIKGQEERVRTDEEGQFLLSNVPTGNQVLEVDGSTTTVPGSWPALEFNVVNIAGQENNLNRPIFLPPLDDNSERVVGGNEDVVLELAGIPGATLTIFANSVTGPNGEDELPMRWTQVNRERVPMPPPLGSQFSIVTTLQPANVTFDPPARVQFPNVNGEPGQQSEIFSFDHDLMDYVSVGTATVSEDGAVMTSDPGFGFVRSGWGGANPPSAPCEGVVSVRPPDTACDRWTSRPAPRCPYSNRESAAAGQEERRTGCDCALQDPTRPRASLALTWSGTQQGPQ